MRSNRIVIMGTAGLVSLLSWHCMSQLQAGQGNAIQQNSELVKAANGALQGTRAEYLAGKASVEDVYGWSRRLREAERSEGKKATAMADHVARMRKLHDKVAALYETGSRGGSERDYYATKFYLLEAEANQAP